MQVARKNTACDNLRNETKAGARRGESVGEYVEQSICEMGRGYGYGV